MTVRPPAVAGRFYPGDRAALTDMIDTALASVELPDDAAPAGVDNGRPGGAAASGEPGGAGPTPAYVVPHAGYRFSGGTAAHGYAGLRARATGISRVVLIGPAHYVRLAGCAVPTVDRWATPLGEVALDTAGRDALVSAGHAVASDEPHAPEHSLEVQLPFLQRVLPGVPVLPVVAGPSTVDTVAALLDAADGPGTVLLCSTDLSHYHDDATARRLDEATVRAVVEHRPSAIGTRDACGVFALRGLTALAARRGWTSRLLDYTTSADTAGTADRVVGYAAFAMS